MKTFRPKSMMGDAKKKTRSGEHYPKPQGHRLSIDPGISGMGIACWDELSWGKRIPPVWVRNIYPKRYRKYPESWETRISVIMFQLDEIFNENYPINHVYMEFPEKENSVRGNAAIVSKVRDGTKEPGDIFKLMYLCGAIGELCRIYDVLITLYLPSEWKGQLSKSIVEDRIKLRIPSVVELQPVSHSWDAIGIGLNAKGFMRL